MTDTGSKAQGIHTGLGQDEISDLIEAAKGYYSGRDKERYAIKRLDKAEMVLRHLVADLFIAGKQEQAKRTQDELAGCDMDQHATKWLREEWAKLSAWDSKRVPR